MSEFAFGYIDDQNEELKTKSSNFGKFGLNQTCTCTKFEFNPNAGKDGSPGDAIDIHFKVGDSEIRSRYYDVTGKLFNSNNVPVGPEDDEYANLYAVRITQILATVTHIAKALGVTSENLQKALNPAPKNFSEWAKIVISLLPKDFTTRTVDIFLEYQWNKKEGNSRKFLILPQNMKGGDFICPSVKGDFTEEKDWIEKSGELDINVKGLRYIDKAKSIVHPLTKNESFMNSNKAKEVNDEDKVNTPNKTPNGFAAAMNTPSGTSDWDV